MKKNLNISNEELLKLDYKHTHLLKKLTNENGKIQGVEKKFPQGPAKASVWEVVWCPESPKSPETMVHVGGLFLVSFWGGGHSSPQGPPVSVTSGGPVGRTTGGAEATENLTRLMTPKGSADLAQVGWQNMLQS